MTQLQRHPLSAAWPDMSEAEFLALRDDIEANGQIDPIMLLDGMVLDGWHRYRACLDLLLEPRFEDWPASQDPRPWVRAKNGARRHLTPSQIALAVTATNSFSWVAHGGNQHEVRGSATVADPPKTAAEIAAEAGVGTRLVEQAKKVINEGAEEVKQAVKAGELPLHEAEKIARLPKEKQGPEVQRRVAEKKKPKERKPREPRPKPEKKGKVSPPSESAAEAFGDDDPAELMASLQKDLDKALADIEAMKADDQKAETLKWRHIAADAQRKQAEQMDAAAQLQRQLTWYANQLKRIGKAIGEDDPTKVAATVEAKMRDPKKVAA